MEITSFGLKKRPLLHGGVGLQLTHCSLCHRSHFLSEFSSFEKSSCIEHGKSAGRLCTEPYLGGVVGSYIRHGVLGDPTGFDTLVLTDDELPRSAS